MNMNEASHFAKQGLRGTLSSDVPMRKFTSWRTGGIAQRMYRPADANDLVEFLRTLPEEEPLYPVGLGSNLLVRDGGLRGTVLLLHGVLNGLHVEPDGSLYVEAGVPGAKLARYAAAHNLGGAEFFAGIPGTLGGMLAMNAGCYGSETWEKVLRVQTVLRNGEVQTHSKADYEIGYRHVARRNGGGGDALQEFFVAAWLKLASADCDSARREIKALLTKRIASQPLNLPNAGSVFRNPPGDYAARLIEQCGLKGKRVGGAQVSEKHANFIVNTGSATATDIENLIEQVRRTVAGQTGVQLHPEVRIVGESK